MKLALIGRDVASSKSPKIHKLIFSLFQRECSYELISLQENMLTRTMCEELFSRFDNLNVTAPYKMAILPYLSSLSGEAEMIGAVNTVLCGEQKGYNFDCDGFSCLLEEEKIALKRALVLGAGGAGRSVAYALLKRGIKVSLYGKYPWQIESAKNFGKVTTSLAAGDTYDLVVNCTGVGMGAREGMLPLVKTEQGEVPFNEEMFLLLRAKYAVDLIYTPKRSAFLQEAEKANLKLSNGESMLFYQAYFADCAFLKREPNIFEAKKFYQKYLEEKS